MYISLAKMEFANFENLLGKTLTSVEVLTDDDNDQFIKFVEVKE